MKKVSPTHIWTLALLVAGNTIGAGILGLPIKTGLAGILPSILCMAAMWMAMLATGWILVTRIINSHHATSDLATLFYQELGAPGKWLSTAGYLIIFYGVLVAYLTGAASILSALLHVAVPEKAWLVIFFIVVTSITLFGVDLARKGNALIMVVLGLSFMFLLVKAGQNADVQRFTYTDWKFVPAIIPIVACAFTFHNVIPTVCRNLQWRAKAVWKVLAIGTFIPLVMNILWILVVIGALPLDGQNKASILTAFHENSPATIPLSLALHSRQITTVGMVFAFTAILTSYLAVGICFMSFIRDITSSCFHNTNRVRDAALTFGPPLAIALIYPNIFLKALDVAGGVGILLVFGLLPTLVFIKNRGREFTWQKLVGYTTMFIFGCLLVMELAQEFGLLQIHPRVEYWYFNLKS